MVRRFDAGFWDSNRVGVEFMKGLQNELAWESAGRLVFFIVSMDRIPLTLERCDFYPLLNQQQDLHSCL